MRTASSIHDQDQGSIIHPQSRFRRCTSTSNQPASNQATTQPASLLDQSTYGSDHNDDDDSDDDSDDSDDNNNNQMGGSDSEAAQGVGRCMGPQTVSRDVPTLRHLCMTCLASSSPTLPTSLAPELVSELLPRIVRHDIQRLGLLPLGHRITDSNIVSLLQDIRLTRLDLTVWRSDGACNVQVEHISNIDGSIGWIGWIGWLRDFAIFRPIRFDDCCRALGPVCKNCRWHEWARTPLPTRPWTVLLRLVKA
jgi:hypothetical protein